MIAREFDLTTIIVTHDPEEALTLSDRVMIVNDGAISQYGKPEEIIAEPKNSFVKTFILNQLEIKKIISIPCFLSGVILRRLFSGERHAKTKRRELKIIFTVLTVIFLIFLAVPIARLLLKSFLTDAGAGVSNYQSVLMKKGFMTALGNSFLVSSVSAVLTTCLAFILAYTVHYTNLGRRYKKLIERTAVLPMLLPTITYGFAIIYSFRQGGC